jgi:hypothetical protein
MRLIALFIAIVFVGVVSIASADSMSSSMGSGGMDTMNWLIGTWHCRLSGGSMSTGSLAFTAEDISTRHVIVYRVTSKPVDSVGYIGYATKEKMFFNTSIDTDGGYGSESSAGWSGSTMAWIGTYADRTNKSSKVRDTYVKLSDSKFTDKSESFDGKKWVLSTNTACSKQ